MTELRIWTHEECEPFETAFTPADLIRVVDGDTFKLRPALRYRASITVSIRLIGENYLINPKIGVDTWEKRGKYKEWGLKAMARTDELLSTADEIRIRSKKAGGFDRWLGLVLVPYSVGWASIGDILLKEKHAIEWWKDRDPPRRRKLDWKPADRPSNPPTPKKDTWSWITASFEDTTV